MDPLVTELIPISSSSEYAGGNSIITQPLRKPVIRYKGLLVFLKQIPCNLLEIQYLRILFKVPSEVSINIQAESRQLGVFLDIISQELGCLRQLS
jgi:hypothetical protein